MGGVKELTLGKAGEHRVISELLLRGFRPGIVCADDGVDIILQNGYRLQVKTSNSPLTSPRLKYHFEYYSFTLRAGKKRDKLERNFDFVICWLIPQKSFYIIPASECKDVKTIWINIKSKMSKKRRIRERWKSYENRWDLLKK